MIVESSAATAVKPTSSSAAEAPFQLKGSSFKLMVLRVADGNDPSFFPRLKETIAQAPNFFQQVPIVLDFGDLTPALDLGGFVKRLRELKLLAAGVQASATELQHAALDLGLPVFPVGRAAGLEGVRATLEAPVPAQEEPQPQRGTMLVTEPVRSGRQVYAARADLIVVAPVSPGAEILADGHIHVYDTMRGRALAGLNGDRTARIFCRKLEAELVSIAGLYKVSEDIDRNFLRSSVQIYLSADRLCIERFQ